MDPRFSPSQKVTIFQECQPEFLHDLVLKMKAYIFTPGDLICRRGEVAREMFIIADGVVEIISETGVMLKRMGAGDFFGEIGILNLDGGINRRSADVRSVGYLELFVLSREDVLGALKDHPEAESIIRDYGQRRLREMEAHRQRVKPVKCQDSSDEQSIPSHTMQNRLLKTLRSLSPAVRRASHHRMQVRSQSSQSSCNQNQASPGPNQKAGSGSFRCVTPQPCTHAPVITGYDGIYKSPCSFQGADSSEDTTSAEFDSRRRYHSGGYISSLYQRVAGLFRRRPNVQRKSWGRYDSCSSSKYYSPSKESHAKDTTSCSPQDSPIPYNGRKCSITVNVESCSDECKSDAEVDYNGENSEEKRGGVNMHSAVNSYSKEFQSGSDGERFHKQDGADAPPNGLGSKLVQVFQGKLKSNPVLYVPVCSEDPDEGLDLLRDSSRNNDEVFKDNCTKDGDSEIKYVREEETAVPEHTLPAVFHESVSERQRTQSFTGDRFSKSVLNDKKIRALQMACVRFSFDSCDNPTGSSRSLAKGISPACPSPKSRSRTPSDNAPIHQPDTARYQSKTAFPGLEDAPKALSSVPLLDRSFYPVHSNSSSSYLQTFSNPDVSSSTTGTESKPRAESSDFRVRGTFLNSSGRLTWKASSMPPLISMPSRGLYHGQSHESDPGQTNADTRSSQKNIVNSNATNRNNLDSRRNQPNGNACLVNNTAASLNFNKTFPHSSNHFYETMIKNIGNNGCDRNSINKNSNNNNNDSGEGFSRKHPAGIGQERVFVSRNGSHQGCNCDPAENFHQFMGKHWPGALQHRGKQVERNVSSASHWHQENRPDMTSPKATGTKLNKDSSCACIRRSFSLPSMLDAFTAASSQTTGTMSSRRLSTQEDICWSSDDAKRLDPRFRKSRFSEEGASGRSMDRDGSVKRGRSKAMSIIQTPASDMAYQQLSDQIHLMQDLLEKRLAVLEEANTTNSTKLDRLAKSHEALLRVFSQQIVRQDSTSSHLPLLPTDDDRLPASCV